MLRKINISKRIIVTVAVLLLFSLGFLLWSMSKVEYVRNASLSHLEQTMETLIRQKLQAAVHTVAVSIGNSLNADMDRNQQIDVIKKLTYNIRFEDDKSGYYFVYENTKNVSLPIKPEVEGKELGDLQDPDGVYFVRKLNDVAHKGGGFVKYLFKKPEKGIQPKISYVELIPGTQFWIGTGQYIDNITDQKKAVSQAMDVILNKSLRTMIGTFCAIVFCIMLPFVIAMVRSISRPLKETETVALHVANGELNVQLPADGRDEISNLQQSINQMIVNLRENMKNIEQKTLEAQEQAQKAAQAAEEAHAMKQQAENAQHDGMVNAAKQLEGVVAAVNSASQELLAQTDQIRHGTASQESKIRETATAMEQMNATIRDIAANSDKVSQEAHNSMDKANEGARIVSDSISAMKEVKELSEFVRENMQELVNHANNINEINTVITSIASQTNLLALNAAIEAARAGEAGKGFAVVADEVRTLAENTMSATTEVNQLIKVLQTGANDNLEGVTKAAEAVAQATEKGSMSGVVLQEIVHMAKNVADQINAIATAATQQSATSEEINSSIEDVRHTTTEINDGMNLTASAVNDLSKQAQNIQDIIASFK